jgi:hypothetical protein
MTSITFRDVKGSPLTNAEVDANFRNLNDNKYESGDNPSFGDLTLTGTQTNSSESVSAAGTTQGTATPLTKTVVFVTSVTASSAEGVALPGAVAGLKMVVTNTTSTNLKVYPASGDGINDLSANAAFTIPGESSMEFYAKDSTNWLSLTQTVIYDSSGTRLN